ncbi:IQ and AAA domain-containing protein 1-like [Musca domestica]|uniref:IQ and AAA domain-containing protein 1-like n=1 Tax=Musca domestica TaxID=7370 RepID=A0A1I8NBX4_MUSDO|nr:IQ and AAA domain-containing protein 1-like [Musca domestica]
MSFDFNYKIWVATKRNIGHLIKLQNVLKKREPIDDPRISFQILSELYIFYGELVDKLTYLHRKTFQVQKRDVIKELVGPAIQTLKMLKSELCSIELSEYVYMDQILIPRKITPYNLCIWRSPDFLYTRPLAYQNFLYDNSLCMDDLEKEGRLNEEKANVVKCVTLLQAHERARSSRVYRAAIMFDKSNLKVRFDKRVTYKFTYKPGQTLSIPVKRTKFNVSIVKANISCQDILKDRANQVRNCYEGDKVGMTEERQKAAVCIQNAWRVYKAKKLAKKHSLCQKRLYGMIGSKHLHAPHERTQSILDLYRDDSKKKMLDSKFEKLITDERTRLLQERAPNIMEDISDHIRAWFKEFYDKAGDFHPYPEFAKNGTVLVLLDETMNLEEFREFQNSQTMSKEEKKAKADKEKQKKLIEKEKIKKKKLKEAKRRKKLKDAGVYDIAYQLSSSKDIEKIEEAIRRYSVEWRTVDEYLNKNSEAISEWVTENELSKIHKELRTLVDSYMRLEYELLKKARCTDNKEKYKPPKEKKTKPPAERKKRKKLDITEHRTIESLYEELREKRIIGEHMGRSFSDFIGEYNFVADDTRDDNNAITTGPEHADMKAVIQDCLLGYGDFVVDKPKSICIIGPANCGKQLLCNVIASELDAVLLDLSPEKTFQFADSVNYFVQIVMKVAKEFQPSILFINDVHRLFWKKIPKDQIEKRPTLLQRVITKKVLKTIKKNDKIMLLGTSDAPWEAKPKFKKIFQKIILVPKSGYGTIYLLWMNMLSQLIGEDAYEDYIITALTKVFRSYNTGEIVGNSQNTLNLKRRMKLQRNGLDPMEFMHHFMLRNEPLFPPPDKIVAKFEKWYNKISPYTKLKALKKSPKKK